MEPLDVYKDAEEGLNRAEYQQRDVMAASPEEPPETHDEGAGQQRNPNEADHVVPVGYVAAADRSRCKPMSEKANDKEYDAEPYPAAAPRLSRCGWTAVHRDLRFVAGNPYGRWVPWVSTSNRSELAAPDRHGVNWRGDRQRW